ncbi:conserved hypothetical protein (putative transposase or invertase) [Desulfonispora thiosulfatigenes DSM 11270]|uniref:Transposase (putative) YhgA-like domain-containing protein n=1 Tax=Desulfonispora thiosulfatigenes DSM 11270 TaxID=656914 RepID=A0A1W1UNI6_DESTI|nr:Rpn family recombination-promoting nuclease/putative transposase [Desulfonispora thiosulfatigenes]SMB82640.1 conserved hypothetical protein (putative transposase or invertase) [Desulfonispora thiosulfatigenes DSM 11270]
MIKIISGIIVLRKQKGVTKMLDRETKNKSQDKSKHEFKENIPEKSKENDSSRVKLDEILKSLFGVSKKVLIQMMNSLFKENFDVNMTDVTFENNEFISDEYDIIRGDLFLKLSSQGGKPYHYHIELQTTNDNSMIIRMFEYGFKKAKEVAKYNNDAETVIYIPRQLVIFIEQNSNIKDELKMRLIFPDGQDIRYTVPVMKYWEYDARTLINEKMYPLLPLQVFKLRYKMESLRKRDENKNNKTNLRKAVLEAKREAEHIALEAKKLYEKDEINGDDLHKVLLAVGNLFEYLNDKYGEDKKLVEEVFSMTRTLYDPVVAEKALARGELKGRKEGRKEGIKEGRKEERKNVARNLLLLGIEIDKIVEATKLSKEEIKKLEKE